MGQEFLDPQEIPSVEDAVLRVSHHKVVQAAWYLQCQGEVRFVSSENKSVYLYFYIT